MTDQYDYSKGGVVKDEFYIRNVEHGEDEYDPKQDIDEEEEPVDLNPSVKDNPHELRDSTHEIAQTKGYYKEDEGPKTGGVIGNDEKDPSRQLSSLVAASHRKGRTPEGKHESALKASELHERITGDPLEINEQGEVLTDKKISSG